MTGPPLLHTTGFMILCAFWALAVQPSPWQGCWIQLPGVPRKVIWYVSEESLTLPCSRSVGRNLGATKPFQSRTVLMSRTVTPAWSRALNEGSNTGHGSCRLEVLRGFPPRSIRRS